MRDQVLAEISQWMPLDTAAIERLDCYIELLEKWNNAYNLVGKSTLKDGWRRHVLDGAQLVNHVEKQSVITDFGSGAGVPAVILALLGYDQVHLVESNRKKCLFLEEVRRKTACSFVVHNARIEQLTPWQSDIITCRAFAEVAKILEYAQPFSMASTKYVLLKGASALDELENARSRWDFVANSTPTALQETGDDGQHGYVCILENVEKIGQET